MTVDSVGMALDGSKPYVYAPPVFDNISDNSVKLIYRYRNAILKGVLELKRRKDCIIISSLRNVTQYIIVYY